MKKIKTCVLIILIIISVSSLWACQTNSNAKETEFFKYHISNATDKDTYACITGFTTKAMEEKYLVIPEEIEGTPVKMIIARGAIIPKAEKVYFPKNMSGFDVSYNSWIKKQEKKAKLIFQSADFYLILKTLHSDIVPIVAEGATLYKEEGMPKQVKIANVTFYYNYQGSPNQGVHFVEDLDVGECFMIKPSIPTRFGCTFSGWFLDEATTIPFDIESYKYVEQEDVLRIYAGWQENN